MSEEKFNEIIKEEFEPQTFQSSYVDPSYIAFILDGKIQFILGTDLRFSAILQSDPIIVDITDHPEKHLIHEGASYDEETGKITPASNVF